MCVNQHIFKERVMVKFLKRFVDPVVPLWAIAPLVLCFIFNCAIYWLTMALCGGLPHYDLTLPIDERIPVVTGWIFIYLGYCYVFWALSYCYIAKVHRDRSIDVFRFVTADIMSRIVCMLFFIFFPTTNTRPEILGDTLSDDLTRFLYTIDEPTNLFPSIHCLVSWLCFIGIRAEKNVKLAVKVFSCASALLIMASTQFLKQHYILDMVSAILLAEICYFIAGKIRFPIFLTRWYSKIVRKLVPGAKLN